MILYPKIYLESIKEITIEFLKKYNIKGIILDVDNTLIDYDRKMVAGAEKWCDDLKEQGIKLCILSNTNKKDKVENVANKLKIPYLFLAKKPAKSGFLKAGKLLGLPNENIAAVGDQIFTDVFGANRIGMFSILVKQVDKKDIFITRIKRPIEKIVIKSYLNKRRKE